MENKKIRVGITHGDINGIGYEVILKTLADKRLLEFCTPIIYGSSKVAAYHRKVANLDISLNQINGADAAKERRANILNCCDEETKVEIGQSTETAGKAAFAALEKATQDLKEGLIDVLLTAPINKKNIQSQSFSFPGHTEYLEEIFGKKGDVLMVLANDNLRVAVATGHLPIAKVAEHLSEELILSKIEIFQKSLKKDFSIGKPRIAVLGLNPHAGDNGVIGNEEETIIIPAIEKANRKGILCFGPISADGFFGSNEFHKYDGILAMYHDQGLIPFKTIAMSSGVNFTAGLDIVRTSPDHGTAYNLAGKNTANEASFRQALYMAIDIYKNRKN